MALKVKKMLPAKANTKNGVSHRPKSQFALNIVSHVSPEFIHSSKLFTREVLNFQIIDRSIYKNCKEN